MLAIHFLIFQQQLDSTAKVETEAKPAKHTPSVIPVTSITPGGCGIILPQCVCDGTYGSFVVIDLHILPSNDCFAILLR